MAEPETRPIDGPLARYLDGEPEPGDGELLAEAMRNDAALAREVGRLLRIDDLLRQSAVPDDRAFLEAVALRLAAAGDSESFVREFQRRVRTGRGSIPKRRAWLPWTIAASASLLALTAAGIAMQSRQAEGENPASSRIAAGNVPGPDRPSQARRPSLAAGSALAMVIKLDGVEWEPTGSPFPAERDLLAAGRLRSRSGRITLSMLTGVTLVVEGPADLELVSPDQVLCHRGKLRAHVPAGSEGFMVSGPGSSVVDLGTEFGLNIDTAGKTRGKVFEGQVEAVASNASGTSQRSQVIDETNGPFEIDPETGLIAALPPREPENFAAAADLRAPELVLGTGYVEAILHSKPWAYWRFETMVEGIVPNEIAGRPPLRTTGPIHQTDLPAGNHAAVFGPEQPGQYLEMDGLWEPAPRPGFAVELWFLSESICHAALASLTTPKNSNKHLFMLETTALDRASLQQRPASVRVLHRWPPGDLRCDNIFSEEPYQPYRWHHLVGQIARDRLELYIDGALVDALPINAQHPTIPCQVLFGRRTTLARRRSSAPRPSFVGRIDEVALYERPLSSEEIQSHFHRATQATGAK